MNLTRLTIVGVLCLGSGPIAQESADALKQRILAQAQSMSGESYAFTRTVRMESTRGGNDEQTVNVERYDPTKPLDSRWSLITVNGAPPPAEALTRYRKEVLKRRVPG